MPEADKAVMQTTQSSSFSTMFRLLRLALYLSCRACSSKNASAWSQLATGYISETGPTRAAVSLFNGTQEHCRR